VIAVAASNGCRKPGARRYAIAHADVQREVGAPDCRQRGKRGHTALFDFWRTWRCQAKSRWTSNIVLPSRAAEGECSAIVHLTPRSAGRRLIRGCFDLTRLRGQRTQDAPAVGLIGQSGPLEALEACGIWTAPDASETVSVR